MPSELDNALNSIISMLTAPGAPLETVEIERFGRHLPMLKNAPPTLVHYFDHYCAQHGAAEFIVDGDIRLTFAEIHAAARTVAGGLVAGHGVQKGDRIGIAARNSANWIVAYMAILMAGGCATLLNGWWAGEELAGGIELAGCSIILVDHQRGERLQGFTYPGKLVTFRHDCPWQEGLSELLAHGGGADTPLPELTGDDLATILYTSGSTGQSKGAWSDHRAVVQATMNYAAQTLMVFTYMGSKGEAPSSQPCSLVNVPLFHVTGMVPLFLQSFAICRKLVLMPKWNAEEAMRLIEKEKVSYFVGVPLMSFEIATHPNRDKYDLSSCTAFAAGGAPRPVDHVTRIRENLPNAFPLLGYGLTETNGVGCGNFNENYLAKPGSTGTASKPLVEIGILNDAGECLPAGEIGEVAIRSIANFLGYWNNTEATKAAIMPDGFFRTGDLGYLDEDGYLFIVDRKKDIIIRGGENISCIEVEQAIYAHPKVSECSVFGMPDERYGELPTGVFLAKDGESLTEEELREFLKANIAAYKVPVRLWQETETLPRLGTEKVDKRTLKARYLSVWESEQKSTA
ncbi:class I adenylate-forming enzyme family protein [Novosphingobium sp.]|uniref:class I adenylate-forming enzyme family protein n=1 Tax=Novosphingobium sp. TaxID=1874826 RepID=UPI0022CB5F83|nr:class I adenylate-forming enzyme family protein [Novosphingobium sp.]MCZ8019177.1 class I adenylate-forming enzyme family protein [Novosphingobium sp.]MCZ8034985.1 class I adenylate-forming enzyme family protein [Novosphingobium sp.]MCZ8052553.1 class I adenylate-forming enzyme family protein [Novosphingobium sp.]MCZ8058652.1 class I adenylate-forming enzyme family protein [Novosphingobium sp.]MCZ8233049.1 class I adenylate-forming enzyme family protein [Novosphingobium sp.]